MNKVSGQWDYGLLADIMEELRNSEIDTAITGFSGNEITELLGELQEMENNEEILENVENISEKINEIYNLHLESENIDDEEKQEMRLEVEIDEGSYSDYKYGYDYNQENNVPDYILRIKAGFKKIYYNIRTYIRGII